MIQILLTDAALYSAELEFKWFWVKTPVCTVLAAIKLRAF